MCPLGDGSCVAVAAASSHPMQELIAKYVDEEMLAEAADKRLRTAVWTLRKAGLEELIVTRDDGYLLDPSIPTSWSD